MLVDLDRIQRLHNNKYEFVGFKDRFIVSRHFSIDDKLLVRGTNVKNVMFQNQKRVLHS